jgi:putative ABC transport system permease protein
MLRHFILISLRSFLRFRTTFLINLIGLTGGLTCSLLIYLWVQDELAVDAYHANGYRIYQVMTNHHNADGIVTMDATPDPLAETLAKEMPEIEYAAAYTPSEWFGDFVIEKGDNKVKATGAFASNDYLKVFTLPILRGNGDQLLKDPNSIIISRSLARKLFDSEDVVGKTIRWRLVSLTNEVTITGVSDDAPGQTTQKFDFILSFEFWKNMLGSQDTWNNFNASAFILVRDGVDIAALGDKIHGFLKTKDANVTTTLLLQPFSRKYLHGTYVNGVPSGGRIEYVRLFSIIAIFILVIACINFMNLSTARASTRLKEVGVKKAFGVARTSLAMQYLTESTAMAVVCLMLSLVVVQISLPIFSLLTDKHLSLTWTSNTAWMILGMTALTGLMAGSYPALLLSGFSPATILKGRMGGSAGEQWARKGLVIFQFTLTIILIASVLVVYKQIEYIQGRHIGFDKEHVIRFQKEGTVATNFHAFLEGVRAIPEVEQASAISQNVLDVAAFTSDISWPGRDATQEIKFSSLIVEPGLIETLGMEMASGRSFSRDFNDSTAVLFNEAAIHAMGMTDPIGNSVTMWGQKREIVGVVKDFHFQSMHESIKPVVFALATQPLDLHHVMVRLSAGNETAAIQKIGSLYSEFNPGYSFDYSFLDHDFQRQYSAETKVASLSRYFAFIAILISCLGLFGLAAFTAERRVKEFGIRKVLGSSDLSLALLLSRDFTRVVLISVVLGIPVSYLLTQEWLRSFAYAIQLEWWYFVVAGLSALLISWLTVGSQALKAARSNIVESLRTE